jgi:hypothetical protein
MSAISAQKLVRPPRTDRAGGEADSPAADDEERSALPTAMGPGGVPGGTSPSPSSNFPQALHRDLRHMPLSAGLLGLVVGRSRRASPSQNGVAAPGRPGAGVYAPRWLNMNSVNSPAANTSPADRNSAACRPE